MLKSVHCHYNSSSFLPASLPCPLWCSHTIERYFCQSTSHWTFDFPRLFQKWCQAHSRTDRGSQWDWKGVLPGFPKWALGDTILMKCSMQNRKFCGVLREARKTLCVLDYSGSLAVKKPVYFRLAQCIPNLLVFLVGLFPRPLRSPCWMPQVLTAAYTLSLGSWS